MASKDLKASVPTTYENLRPANEHVNELKNGFPQLSLQMRPQLWPSAQMQNDLITFIFSDSMNTYSLRKFQKERFKRDLESEHSAKLLLDP